MRCPRVIQYFVPGLLAVLFVNAARAQQTVTRSYPLPEHGSIAFKIPSSWKDQIQQLKGDLPPTITWSQQSPHPASEPPSQQPAAPFRILVTVGWQGQEAGAKLTEAELKQRVDQGMAAAESQAAEKQLEMKELRGPSVHGYYFSATDRAPKPGEHKYLTQGIALSDDLIVAFTIFTNQGQQAVVTEALNAIGSATHHHN
jgi:hypothetical protein